MSAAVSIEVEVSAITRVAERIKRFRLAPVPGETLPAWSPGAHILVTLVNGSNTWRNAYSLMGSPLDHAAYEISVLHTTQSRGGSGYLHQEVVPGMRLRISPPVNLFSLAPLARKHIFVAGGIGITPFLPMMQVLRDRNVPFELHYVARDRNRAAYVEQITHTYGSRVHLYQTVTSGRPSLQHLLDGQPLGTHLYVCGPPEMTEELLAAGRAAGWPEAHLHSERFLGGSAGQPFTLSLKDSEQVIHVNEHQSILEALEAADIEAPFLCRGGSCGQCETRVMACDTELLHNDHYLSPEERQSGGKIMICVSRCQGGHLVLDL
jgi:dimethylamine monooxygenase subunit B